MRGFLILYLLFIIAATGLISWLVLKMQVKRPFRLITLILILVSSPMILSYFLMSYLSPVPETIVPQIIGLTEQDAIVELSRLGLSLKVEARYEEGTLISFQRPEPGRVVKEGRVVSVILGKPKTISPLPAPAPTAEVAPAPPPATTMPTEEDSIIIMEDEEGEQ